MMKNPPKFWFLLAILFLATTVNAQQYLFLKKKETTKAKRIELYTTIGVKTVPGQEEWTIGELTSVNSTEISLDNLVSYALADIYEIRIYKTSQKAIGKGFKIAALGYLVVTTVNWMISGTRNEVVANHAIAAGGLYGLGWLVQLTSKKKYDLNEGWKLEGIDFNELIDD